MAPTDPTDRTRRLVVAGVAALAALAVAWEMWLAPQRPGGSLLVSCNYAEWSQNDLKRLCDDALRGFAAKQESGNSPPEIPRAALSLRVRRTT